MLTITLIRPSRLISINAYATPTCPPIGMAYIASSLKNAGFTVNIIDSIGEDVFSFTRSKEFPNSLIHGLPENKLIEKIPPQTDILGFSCMFSEEWPFTRNTIEKVKKAFPKTFVIAGGEHITAMPEYILEDCRDIDVCVLGEGEETATELCHSLSKRDHPEALSEIKGIVYRSINGLQQTPERKRLRNIDDIPIPAWDLLPIHHYLDNGLGFGVNRGRMMPLIATRGCPYQCTFCSNPTMWTTLWIARSPQKVFEEMLLYIKKYNARSFDFYDLTAIVKRDWIIQFAKLIIESKVDICWQLPSGTRSEAIDTEVARLLYLSGCRNLSYAPESGAPTELKRIKKKVKIENMLVSMKACISNKLNLKANIIVGMPGQTWKELLETIKFIFQMATIGVHDMSISIYSCYPGSELFNELRKSGKIKINDAFFLRLSCYGNLTSAFSSSEYISNRALIVMRFLGFFIFYSMSFLLHPHRVIRLFSNYFRGIQESRLEMAFRDFIKRKTLIFRPKQSSPSHS